MTLGELIDYLKNVAERPASDCAEAAAQTLANLKAEAVSEPDEVRAKLFWCLQEVLRTQNLYLRAFNRLKEGEFYQAWCDFEQVEIGLHSLGRHLVDGWVDVRLDAIKKHTANWQSLFPYRMFLSPEMVCRAECSVCGQAIQPRKPCGHVVGEIYAGEECHRVIKSIDAVLGIAMVSNPVQKYSVLFPNGSAENDTFRYEAVKYLIQALRGPFDDWDVERTTRRQPHGHFTGVGRNDLCPCESGKKYKKCCLPEVGVLRPHMHFTLAVPPPENVPQQWFPRDLRHKPRHKARSKRVAA